MRFKKIIGFMHLWLGLASGLIVLIVAITGCIYVFSQEITNVIRKEALHVPLSDKQPLPVSELWQLAQSKMPVGYPISRAVCINDPSASWQFSAFKSNDKAITYFGSVDYYYTLYINPYTGEVTGRYDEKFDFFNIVKFLHWSLLLETGYGQPIVGWSTFIFVIMLVTGLILWWPKNKNAAKQRVSFKWKSTTQWKRKNYDLHNILGFYVWSFLLIIAFTGMVWAFTWFQALVYVAGSGTTAPPNIPVFKSVVSSNKNERALDSALSKSRTAYPTAYSFGISPARDSAGVIHVYVQPKEGVYYISHAMQYDQYSGILLGKRDHSEKNFGEKLITANYDIHVGAILGIPGKVLAFIASLVCASLPLTGFMIWRGRRRQKKTSSS